MLNKLLSGIGALSLATFLSWGVCGTLNARHEAWEKQSAREYKLKQIELQFLQAKLKNPILEINQTNYSKPVNKDPLYTVKLN